jgi:single-strand DNA-binding protein
MRDVNSLNRVILAGHIGQKPELRVLPQREQSVARFSLATSENFYNKTTNESTKRTEWHRIVAWGKLAEFCDRFLDKGKQILVEGKLRTRSWQDREGNKRTTTEIEATSIILLGRREVGSEGEGHAPRPTSGSGSGFHQDPAVSEFPGEDDTPGDAGGDDEVPF